MSRCRKLPVRVVDALLQPPQVLPELFDHHPRSRLQPILFRHVHLDQLPPSLQQGLQLRCLYISQARDQRSDLYGLIGYSILFKRRIDKDVEGIFVDINANAARLDGRVVCHELFLPMLARRCGLRRPIQLFGMKRTSESNVACLSTVL
jgi:hypothetical protein